MVPRKVPGAVCFMGRSTGEASALWAEAILKKEAMGFGDVKFLGALGAFVGWKLTLVTLMMASISGSLVGVLLIAARKGDMKYALPFGTFLAMGAALAATVGPTLLDWYLSLYPAV